MSMKFPISMITSLLMLVGALIALFKCRSLGLYEGPFDDHYLEYFERGKKYSLIELIRRIDHLTDGNILVDKDTFSKWLEQCVLDGKLQKEKGKRRLKNGRYETELYSLT